MRGGAVVAQGPPADIVSADLVGRTFGLSCQVMTDPETGTPMVVPGSRTRRTAGPRRDARYIP